MDRVIEHSIEVAVSPGRAWRAFLNVGELLNWLCDGAVVGDHRGGRWAVGWMEPGREEGEGATTIGTIGDVVAGRSIVVEEVLFEAPGSASLGPSKLEFLFEELGESSTRVTIRQTGLGDEPEIAPFVDGIDEGWGRSLEALRSWLETGVSPRR